jgi:hypothetical protein
VVITSLYAWLEEQKMLVNRDGDVRSLEYPLTCSENCTGSGHH